MKFSVDYTKNEVTINNATKSFWGGVYVVKGGGICSEERGTYSDSYLNKLSYLKIYK